MLVLVGQGFEIVVSLIQLIGCQSIRQIDGIEPTLRFQNRLPIVSVVIQQDLNVSFVMVSVGLRTDEGSIESNTDLFEDGVSYVVDQIGMVGCYCIVPVAFLQSPFQFKVAAREIDVIFLRIDLKIDGVDAGREGMNGDHAITQDAEIGEPGNPKQIQHGVLHTRRPRQRDDVRHHRLRLRLFFRALLTQS